MPVEFVTDDEAAAYGRAVPGSPRSDLVGVFFLGDEDGTLVGLRRGDHMKDARPVDYLPAPSIRANIRAGDYPIVMMMMTIMITNATMPAVVHFAVAACADAFVACTAGG
jgi:hypothetical protein